MITKHKIFFDSLLNQPIKKVDLIVTSPPYPMVEMWDNLFNYIPYNKTAHMELCAIPEIFHDKMIHTIVAVLKKACKMLKIGGIICVNIGDATRTLKLYAEGLGWHNRFQLFNNHAALSNALSEMDLEQLPGIIWRKPTNSPNKFMGSGTLPVKAYITLEHEYILVFRKGLRVFSKKEDKIRKRSAFFWEERNKWFSDLWEIRGSPQVKNELRTAAYPLEIPFRLINMFSIQGDTVLDPYLGSGTTLKAAAISGRNSVSFEINQNLKKCIANSILELKALGISHSFNRLEYHLSFSNQNSVKYSHKFYGPVKTKQETFMLIPQIDKMNFHKISNTEYELICKHKFMKGNSND